jgi:hypothetical protein
MDVMEEREWYGVRIRGGRRVLPWLKPLGWKGVETPWLLYLAGPGRKTAGLRTGCAGESP